MINSAASEPDPNLYQWHYTRGWKLVEGLLLLDGKRRRFLTWFRRRRLRKALVHFTSALELFPSMWQCMMAVGKIHQRLGEHDEALAWFRRAQELAPSESAVAREAGIEALETRDVPFAEQCFRTAIRAKPEDAGLLSNLAIAELMAGSVDDAKLARDPSDKVAAAVRRAVERVQSGRATVPRSMSEVRMLAK